jgi:2-(1,2-epoxy-1,2-dihydrophenyl)acetyl-CoA isomerase
LFNPLGSRHASKLAARANAGYSDPHQSGEAEMAEYANLLFEIKNHVAHVTLNRPDAANGINLELAREFSDVARRCGEDAGVRAVLISGAGKMFCAGGDLKAFAAQPEGKLADYLERVTGFLHRGILMLAHCSAPVVAAVHGSAAGGGFSLTCACDFVIAAQSAKFTMAYTRAGLTPDGSGSYFLPRIVGFRKALELAIRNPVLSAIDAHALGIVTEVVPDAELSDRAGALTAELAAGPTQAYGGVKRLLLESANATLEDQMKRETGWIAEMSQSRDGREGIAAFVGKRAPKFLGE